MNFPYKPYWIIIILLNSCIVYIGSDEKELSSETTEKETINESIEVFDTGFGLPFIKNSTVFKKILPKHWIKDNDIENRRSEDWADPPVPLLRVAYSSSETNISKYLLPHCGEIRASIPRIVGGKDAPEGVYPWIVLILNNGDPWCGGSILNEEWVLSAAHCFMLDANPAIFSIQVGSVNRKKGTNYKIVKIIIHERFHLDNMFNSDIALLKISKKIKLGRTVSGICLPHKTFEEPNSKEFLVVGWGQTSYESRKLFPEILQQVTLTKVDLIECSKKYMTRNIVIYRSQLCTWKSEQDACQGDSGSAVMEMRGSKMYQVGLVSYGTTCADEFPGVYTRISYFLTWIIKTLRDNK